MSKRIDFGPVLPMHKGEWKAGTVYERLNTVRHNSASWVCKVTSTTAEPSDNSPDWFLQSEDSVSVASVNGQTGIVRITDTLTTPAADDDSTLIANTAWVNDRIAKVLDDVDAAIGTASVDILNQATAHTAETVSNAINNYDTENASKFVSKTELDVVRSNTVDIVKDQVIDGVKTFSKPIEGSITGSAAKASQDALGNTIDTTYATKQSVTDLSTSVSSTYLSKTDAAATYITPDGVDTKVTALDNKLTGSISTAQSTADTANTTATEALTAANTKISISGNRGALAGYEISGISITIDENSTDANEVSTAITVNNGTVGTSWTKIVHNTAVITATLGDKWSWVNASAPKITAEGIFVFCWCGSKGLANYISAVEG